MGIHFMHRFMHVVVDFEVTGLACKQHEVRVLAERREVLLSDAVLSRLTPEEGVIWHNLNAQVVGTKHGIGRIPFGDLLEAIGGVTAQKASRRIHDELLESGMPLSRSQA